MRYADLPRDQLRAIRADYAARTPEGRYRYAVLEVAKRNGVSPTAVTVIARRYGLGRYLSAAGMR